ncbi:MAG: zf-HC2 domain-containing protein [Chloroflexota bacterium]|nr:zf-HC2 domain-containing protein [Chloroflexota bacterium]
MSDRQDNATTPAGGPNCAAINDLIAPFALDAIEPEERRLVEHHLLACGRCARALHEQHRAVNLFPFMAPTASPSPEAKTELFRRIERSRPARDVERTTPPTAWPWNPPNERGLTLPSSRLPVQPAIAGILNGEPGRTLRKRSVWLRVATPFVVVPLVLTLLAVSGWAGMLRNQMTDQEDEIQTLQARLETMNGLVTEPDGTVYTYNMVAGPGDVARRAVGKFMVNAVTGESMMMVENLEPESTYRIWGVNADDEPVRVGDLVVDSNGSGRQVLDLNGLLRDYQSFHVSRESLDTADEIDPNTPNALSVSLVTRELSAAPSGSDTHSRASIGNSNGSGVGTLATATPVL